MRASSHRHDAPTRLRCRRIKAQSSTHRGSEHRHDAHGRHPSPSKTSLRPISRRRRDSRSNVPATRRASTRRQTALRRMENALRTRRLAAVPARRLCFRAHQHLHTSQQRNDARAARPMRRTAAGVRPAHADAHRAKPNCLVRKRQANPRGKRRTTTTFKGTRTRVQRPDHRANRVSARKRSEREQLRSRADPSELTRGPHSLPRQEISSPSLSRPSRHSKDREISDASSPTDRLQTRIDKRHYHS